MGSEIHPTAIIADDVQIGEGCIVGPYTVIEAGARIGADNEIAPGCFISGAVELGNGNRLMRGASLGGEPQSLGYKGEPTRLTIGDRNWFGENVVVHRGTAATGVTVVGDDLYMMNGAHIGHDVRMGNHVVMAPAVNVGGQAEVGHRANLGAGAGIHQLTRVGELVMVGAMTRVTQDVVPFTTVAGDCELYGLNSIGIRRAEDCPNQLGALKEMYTRFCRKREPLAAFQEWLGTLPPDHFSQAWAAFLAVPSKRGYARGSTSRRRSSTTG
jgi:UDP-N-acetylglucosamine acyltransferase